MLNYTNVFFVINLLRFFSKKTKGIPGIVNGTLVNPYINYPYVPQVVDFLENYTRISHELGMVVKYYYTIRELSNHAAETYALLSLNGEVMLKQSAYIIAQQVCRWFD